MGRSPANDIAIPDKTVSGAHATITVTEDKVIIRDHSKNGTFVNGRKVSEAQLRIGDRIRVGTTNLQFCAEPVATDAPTVIASPEERTRVQKERVAAAQVKKDDSGQYRVVEQPKAARTVPGAKPPVGKKKKPGADPKAAKRRKLILVGIFTACCMMLICALLTPGKEEKDESNDTSDTTEVPGTVPPMRVDIDFEFRKIKLNELPDEVHRFLDVGKDRYDLRGQVDGRLYGAIDIWEESVDSLSGDNASALRNCIYTAKLELENNFKADSTAVELYMNQEDSTNACRKLEKIIQDIPSYTDHRHAWAKELFVTKCWKH